MNPGDLLYTNVFETTNVLSSNDLNQSKENYTRFRNYVGGRQIESNEYIREDTKESDPLNINKMNQDPWPSDLRKNHYPKFSSTLKDISDNRYQKNRITKISVNSRDRDISNYLYPNNFGIPFDRIFTNIQHIRLTDLCFPNFFPPINNYNNCLAWQYASQQLLISNLIDDNIIPVPINYKTISYSAFQNAVSNIPLGESSKLVYQTFIPEGNYTVKSLVEQIRVSTAQVVHGCSYLNYLDLFKNNLSNKTLPGNTKWKEEYEEPYYSTKIGVNTPTLMKFSINPIKNTVFAVNRMEEIEVLAVQTFEDGTTASDLSEYDVFNPYVTSTVNSFSSNYIYVTVKDLKTSTSLWETTTLDPNPFPLVLTDVGGDIGNIPNEFFNYTEFFDLNIYLSYGYTEDQLDSISTYKVYDKIQFTDVFGITHKYIRLALKFSTGNIYGRRDLKNSGWVIYPSTNTTNVYNTALFNSLIIGETNNGYFGENLQAGLESKNGKIGRALLFRFIFDLVNGSYVDYETETDNVKKRSILNMLAWPIPNNTYETLVVSSKPTFSFVHSNIDGFLIQNDLQFVKSVGSPITYKAPSLKLNLQMVNGEYYFTSNMFLFLKITPLNAPITTTNMSVASSNLNHQINQNYVNDSFFDTGIGGDYQCLAFSAVRQNTALVKNYQNIFGKVLLSPIPNNIENNLNVNDNFAFLYEKPIDELSGIQIQILDPHLIQYNLGRDFSFTIEITEVVDVLKETLIDTKRDTVVTTGYKVN